MISIGKMVDAGQVVRYLVQAARDVRIAYYAAPTAAPGRWTGRAAAHLGLDGPVTAEQLSAVLAGTHPDTGADLMERRWSKQSVAAYDVTFSVPKSVSLLWAVGDEATRAAVLRAHEQAVDAVCEYLQAHAAWGRRYDREAEATIPVRASLVPPRFLHCTARPVTDAATGVVTVDPQLHTHVPIPNYVLRDDGTWGQLHGVALYRHASSAGAVGQAVLRDALVRELGVAVTVARNGTFEVDGITRAMRQEFSRRAHQVAALDAAVGVESWYGHKLAVLASREGKRGMGAEPDVVATWRLRAATVGLDADLVAGLLGRQRSVERGIDIADVRRLVGEHGLTAEAATFTRRDVVRAVARHAPLGLPLADLERVVDTVLADRGNVVPLGDLSAAAMARLPASFRAYLAEDRRYSTPEMTALEEQMLATAQAGRLAWRGVAASAAVDEAIAARPTLTAEQEIMIRTICRRGEAVALIEGAAGSGKTAALAACREAFEASGHRVIGAALSANAAFRLGEQAGIPSSTVHSLLARLQHTPESVGTVVVIDEAAMVGSRQVAQLVACSERDGTKLVLVGDPRQLHAIDGGAAFRALGDHLGSVRLIENVRQADDWQRAALAALRDGSVAEAVREYVAHGVVVTGGVGESGVAALRQRVLRDYETALERGRDAIMLTHRRADVDALNRFAHAYAERSGRLEGPAILVGSTLVRLDGSVEVPREMRAGDLALCTENDHERGLTNGMRVRVIGVDPELHTVTLRTPDDSEVTVDVRHYDAIDHGYAMTVHKAQGLSVDVSLVLASGDEGREWTYTAMSRGRENNVYYTPSAPSLTDEHGSCLHEERPDELAERLERSWIRSRAHDSTLDYERLGEFRRIDDRLTPGLGLDGAPGPGIDVSPDFDLSHDPAPSLGGPSAL